MMDDRKVLMWSIKGNIHLPVTVPLQDTLLIRVLYVWKNVSSICNQRKLRQRFYIFICDTAHKPNNNVAPKVLADL